MALSDTDGRLEQIIFQAFAKLACHSPAVVGQIVGYWLDCAVLSCGTVSPIFKAQECPCLPLRFRLRLRRPRPRGEVLCARNKIQRDTAVGQAQDGLQQEDDIMEVGPHTFPRDWLDAQSGCRLKLVSSLVRMTATETRRPDVYSESDALRALLRRRGPCASKRVAGLAGSSKVFGLHVHAPCPLRAPFV